MKVKVNALKPQMKSGLRNEPRNGIFQKTQLYEIFILIVVSKTHIKSGDKAHI